MVEIEETTLDLLYGFFMGSIATAIIYSYFLHMEGLMVGLLGSGIFFDIWFTGLEAISILGGLALLVFVVYSYLSEKFEFGR